MNDLDAAAKHIQRKLGLLNDVTAFAYLRGMLEKFYGCGREYENGACAELALEESALCQTVHADHPETSCGLQIRKAILARMIPQEVKDAFLAPPDIPLEVREHGKFHIVKHNET